MHQFKYVSALLVSIMLAGCGGGGSDLPAKPKFTSHVAFGDSLSDVGTYNVGFVAASGVGTAGQFSINGPNGNGKAANGNNITNWTEVVSASLGLPAPCPAVTGLIDTAGADALSVAVVTHPGCTGYAQGGALVTNPYGIHNTHYGTYAATSGLGGAELTYPVVTQINNYLTANGGSFSGNELVSVVVGGNEIKLQLTLLVGGAITAAVTTQIPLEIAAGRCTSLEAATVCVTSAGTTLVTPAISAQVPLEIAAGRCTSAQAATVCAASALATLGGTNSIILQTSVATSYLTTNGPLAVAAMASPTGPAADLVKWVDTLILAKGAKHVVVTSIPDFADIPALAAYSTAQRALVDAMVTTFNSTLKTGLAALGGNVVYVDTYTSIKDEITNPSKYNLTNATTPVCTTARALLCNASTLIAGQTADTHYLFADDTHPTPYGHVLFGQYVLQTMTAKGWY